MHKKRPMKPLRVQADKNYIEVMGKIFAVLEHFVEVGATQKSVAFVEVARPFRSPGRPSTEFYIRWKNWDTSRRTNLRLTTNWRPSSLI